MNLPIILIIDDQFGRSTAERLTFTKKTSLLEIGVDEIEAFLEKSHDGPEIAAAVFCSGQILFKDRIVNDYEGISSVVGRMIPYLSLVCLDVRFDSGNLLGGILPEGQSGDERFGLDVRDRLLLDFPGIPLVMLTSKHEEDVYSAGAYFLSKEGINADAISCALVKYGKAKSGDLHRLLRTDPNEIVESRQMADVFAHALIVANTNAPVLLLGETGTGKEIVARYIYRQSERRDKQFLGINVTSVAEDLLDSELFGIESKVATSVDARAGIFERASGGTLFLDEIGDMPISTQSKVLRVLQEGVVCRIGGTKDIRVNIRYVFATHRNIQELVASGKFREDLYYRISAVVIQIPPLRNRRDDILPLSEHFLARFSKLFKKSGIKVHQDARKWLAEHDFPGNIRELQNLFQYLVSVKGNNSLITKIEIQNYFNSPYDPKRPTTYSVAIPPVHSKSVSSDDNAQPHLSVQQVINLDNRVLFPSTRLRGTLPALEEEYRSILCRLAGAALDATKDPISGELNCRKAMSLLLAPSGQSTPNKLSSTESYRVFNKCIGRNQTEEVTKEVLEKIWQLWLQSQN